MIPIDLSQPIYQQIVDGVVKMILRGEKAAGSQIPSQREMAAILRVSPNTVQRAYRDLEAMGIVETARGQGTFIRARPEDVDPIRRRLLGEAVGRFLREMRSLGIDDTAISARIEAALRAGPDGPSVRT